MQLEDNNFQLKQMKQEIHKQLSELTISQQRVNEIEANVANILKEKEAL